MDTFKEICNALASRKPIRLACPGVPSVTGTVQTISFDGTPGFYIVTVLTFDGTIATRTIETKIPGRFANRAN